MFLNELRHCRKTLLLLKVVRDGIPAQPGDERRPRLR